jgi:Rhamnogalacturonan I lyases beta-sheet domain
VDEIMAALAKSEYRFSALNIGAIKSGRFQKRTARGDQRLMTARIENAAFAGVILLGFVASPAFAQRRMESLGRGIVAIREDGGNVFVSWRMLGTDPDDVMFNLYRSTGGAPPVKRELSGGRRTARNCGSTPRRFRRHTVSIP